MDPKHLDLYLQPNPNIMPTFTSLPTTTDYKYQELILGLNIQPFGNGSEEQLPEISFGTKGIVRCDFCKAYMNPMNIFQDNGEKYQCSLCCQFNETPTHYTHGAQIEHMTYDILPAPNEFKTDLITTDPYFVLIIQNTQSLAQNGLQEMLKASILTSLQSLDPDQNIIILTYDSQSMSIYDLSGDEPVRYIVTDADEKPFKLKESRLRQCKDSVEDILESLGEMRHPLGNIRNNLLMASKAADYATRLMHNVPGKIFHIFTNDNPYKTIQSKDPDKGPLSPNSTFFSQKAQRCVKQALCYTIFLFSSCSSDVVTTSDITRLTWGNFYLYNRTQSQNYRFYYDMIFELTQPTVFNCTDRLRTSCFVEQVNKKLVLKSNWKTTFTHNKVVGGLTGMTSVNPHKILVTELELLCPTTETHLVLQNSLLYTDCRGVKRVRVSNLVVKLEKTVTLLRELADVESLKAFYTRKIIYMVCGNRNIENTRDVIVKYCKGIHSRRKTLQWVNDLLMISLAILKSKVLPMSLNLTKGKHLDELWVGICEIIDMPDWQVLQSFLPHLYEVNPQNDASVQSNPLSLAIQSIKPNNIYILDKPHRILIYFVGTNRTTQQVYQLTEGQQANNNQLGAKIAQLRSFKLSGFAPISYIQTADQGDSYLQFMNSLVLSKGKYGFDYDFQQFNSMLN